MDNFPHKNDTYRIIGLCMDVQTILGYGFSETVYKDAIQIELINNQIPYIREAELKVSYKGSILQHRFFADFICFRQIIVEVKSSDKGIIDDHVAQTLNYLRVSGILIGLIVNFGRRKLEYRRLIFS